MIDKINTKKATIADTNSKAYNNTAIITLAMPVKT